MVSNVFDPRAGSAVQSTEPGAAGVENADGVAEEGRESDGEGEVDGDGRPEKSAGAGTVLSVTTGGAATDEVDLDGNLSFAYRNSSRSSTTKPTAPALMIERPSERSSMRLQAAFTQPIQVCR